MMNNDERDKRIGVVGRRPGLETLRRMEEENRIREAEEAVMEHAESEMAEMEVKEDSPPRAEVHSKDPATMAAVLGALEANGIPTSLPKPPKKVPKERPSEKEQQRRMSAAEAKRERRRQRRLKKGT